MDRGAWWATVHETAKELDTKQQLPIRCHFSFVFLQGIYLYSVLSLFNSVYFSVTLQDQSFQVHDNP